jgi:acetyltransferase-like isoleucine patch superfamily enzyme
LFSKRLNQLLSPFFVLKKAVFPEKPLLTIPFGRHSYGPQPQLLGFMPWLARKARGSSVGNFCSLSDGVVFSFLGKHNYEWVSTYPFYDFFEVWGFEDKFWRRGVPDEKQIEATPIIIENDVWVASNVVFKEGVKVCNGAVVAMGSLVTKDVPAYALVGGNPARVIKYRFPQEQIDTLQEIAWWNWTDRKIKKVLPLLLSEDVEALIRYSKKQN